jgi:hypothetical protein
MLKRFTNIRRIVPVLPRLILPILLIAFLVQGFSILSGYRYQMNPDGVSYLTIAKQYLHGHWWDAVNAYWSPLYSWLLVPLLGVGVEPLLATKVLALFIGTGILATAWWLGANLGMSRDMRVLALITLMPILYYFGMFVTTPDLLMSGALLLYLAQTTSPRWGMRWHSGLATGALGGLAYLAKAYALPVVAAHLAIVGLISILAPRLRRVETSEDLAPSRGRLVAHLLVSVAVMGMICGAWGMVLGAKYGSFTFGSTGRFNLAWNGPKFSQPAHGHGLVAPPNDTGTSAWDDATVLTYPEWNPRGTPEEREHFRKHRQRNWEHIKKISLGFTDLLWAIVILGAMLAASGAEPSSRRPGMIVLIALVIYPAGYYLLHVEQRFMSFVCLALLMIGGFIVASCARAFGVDPVRRFAVMALLCASFLYNPNWKPETEPLRMALGRWSIARLWNNTAEIIRQAELLAGVVPPRSRIASAGDWGRSLYLAFLLDLRYHGEVKPRGSNAEIEAQLKEHEIEYFWVWGDPNRFAFLRTREPLPFNQIPNLRIYPLDPAPTSAPGVTP